MSNAADTKGPSGILVTGDLIFSTKITGTAGQLGLKLTVAASPESAIAQIVPGQTRLVLLDLALAELTAQRIAEIVGQAGEAAVVAYGSHVDTTRLASARDAGCARVLPRSQLAAQLPQLLKQYILGGPDGAE